MASKKRTSKKMATKKSLATRSLSKAPTARTGTKESLDKNLVLAECRITQAEFERSACDWADLEWICTLHVRNTDVLRATAQFLADSLRQLPQVHSLKFRVKDPRHLLAKVIRKRLDDPKRVITPDNYTAEITDLIGIRALHLFKADWRPIHEFVRGCWRLFEPPIAFHRKGDQAEVIRAFKEAGCVSAEHPDAYRSVHYLLECRPTKDLVVAELQVRTVFEEGWSEIDHLVRYPHSISDQLLNQYLTLFNRAAGIADEMGAFLQQLKAELASREERASEERSKMQGTITALETEIGKLKLTAEEKMRLEKELASLRKAQVSSSRAAASVTFGDVLVNSKPGYFSNVAVIPDRASSSIASLIPSSPSVVSLSGVMNRKCSVCGRDLPYGTIAGDKCLSCFTTRGITITGV